MEVISKLLPKEECLELAQGETTRNYPYIWLRDNCLCEICYNYTTQSRRTRLEELQLDPAVSKLVQKNNDIIITWDDGHVSTFPISWLIEHTFLNKEAVCSRNQRYKHVPKLWGAELQGSIPTFNFQKLLSEDECLFDYIVTMDTMGVCIIESAPAVEGQVAKVASRIAFLKPSSYGRTVFHVRSQLHPSNAGYTSEALDLHTDQSFSYNPSGVQILHCISQAGEGEGGESTVADGFYAASQLKEQHPDYYKLLCNIKLDFFDIGSDVMGPYNYIYHGPIFILDCYGELEQVRFGTHTRDSFMGDIAPDQVKDVYKALKMYDDLLRKSLVIYRLKPGDILVVDNRRVMHGRKAYTVTPGRERLLEGGYIDWDPMYSAMRVLAEKLNKY